MIVRLKHQFSLWVSVIALIALVAITIALCLMLGVKTGLTIGVIAFLFFGGLDAVWYLLTRKMEKRIDDAVGRSEVERSYSGSEDNPTIR